MNTSPYRILPVVLLALGMSVAACDGTDLPAGSGETVVDADSVCASGPGCVAQERLTCMLVSGDDVTEPDAEVDTDAMCWELVPSDSTASELIWALTPSTDGGYLAAGESTNPQTRYGAKLWKVSRDGRLQWSRSIPGRRGRIEAVEATPDSGYIATGWIARSAEVMHAWVLKLDADGALQWERVFDSGDWMLAFDVGLTQDGGTVIAGSTGDAAGTNGDVWVVRLDGSGAVLWERALGYARSDGATAIHQTADGAFLVAGAAQNPEDGADLDLWLLKLDAAGEVLWERIIGGDRFNIIQAMEPTSDGGCVVAGHVDDLAADHNLQGWVVKLDDQGQVEWEREYGDSRNEEFLAVAPATDGGYVLTGYAEDADSGIGRFWLLKVDASGESRWERRYGEEGGPVGTAVLQADDGSILAAGAITEGNTLSAAPWVFKIGPDGDCGLIDR